MSDQHHDDDGYDDHHRSVLPGGGHRRAPRGGSFIGSAIKIVIALVVVAVVAVVGVRLVQGFDFSNPFSSDAEDFAGPGTGSVVFEVQTGDSISVQARNLEELGVVASAEAYVDAASDNEAASGIREGVYRVRKEMKAADVVTLLASGTTKGTSFTFTAGKTVSEIVTLLTEDTDIGRKQFNRALAGTAIGLPASAKGDAEGYLSPGSYTFFPDDDATTILSAMVARTAETMAEVDVAGAAERLGYSERDLLIIASLIEAEGSLLDEEGKSKIARVIYNRLENPTAGTVGRLQIDATIDFIYGDKVARRSTAEIEAVADNPYNTYRAKGLPPGPIATPSTAALEAAAEPADGPWFYYATVNLRTGETKFAVTREDFAVLEAELDAYCANESKRC